MSAQKKKPADITARLLAHAAAMTKAKEWAKRGLDLVEKGKIEQARKAESKAKWWFEKARRLEGRGAG